MRKTLIVAQSEFNTLVRSKAFLISLLLMPVVIGVSILLLRATKDSTDSKDRAFAVVDYSGVIAEPLTAVAGIYNASGPVAVEGGLSPKGPRFIPVIVKPGGRMPADAPVELSDRVP